MGNLIKKIKVLILFWKKKASFLEGDNHFMDLTIYFRLQWKGSVNMEINRNYILQNREKIFLKIKRFSKLSCNIRGYPGGTSGEEANCQCRRCKRQEFSLWVGKSPCRRAWKTNRNGNIYVYINIYTHIYVCIVYMYMYVCVYIYTYTYIYICCAVLSCSVMSNSLWPHGLCVAHHTGTSVHGDSPGKTTGMSCHVLLQGIFPN